MKHVIVTGASGFIGSHVVAYLKQKKYRVTGIDIKSPEFSKSKADTLIIADLRSKDTAEKIITQADELYMFAANMGGIGYISTVHADIMHDNTLITINSIEAAKKHTIKNIFFSSSACVYPINLQTEHSNISLKESDVYPAHPDTPYGWEKLYSELLCRAYADDFGMNIHIGRFHNIYGPEGAYIGGREKSPAALCRKIAMLTSKDELEIWGDGKQQRSYCYIDDCCDGIYRLMQSKYLEPLNIGSDRLVSINELVDIISKIANKAVKKQYNMDKPQGVKIRNSDNTQLKNVLKWEPTIPLEIGLKKTYDWIYTQVHSSKKS